jgi:hypothetical protein
MKLVKILAFLLFLGLFGQAALAQCCCSGAQLAITNGAFPLPKSEVAVKQVSAKESSDHISFNSETDAMFRFYVGCGNGKETLAVEHLGVVMRIRFKLHGDFGSPKAEIPFQTGDYVAEFAKEGEDEGGRKIVLRPATYDEMKEVEPEPEPAADGLLDQTADAI